MEGHSHPCVKLLAAHAYRWGKHDIFLPWRTAYNSRSVQNNLPLLEALEIERFGDNDEPPLQADVLDYFSVAPHLRKFTLKFRLTAAMPQMPWGQLVSMKLQGGNDPTKCHDLLQNCNLAICGLAISYYPDTELTIRPLLVCPSIKELYISRGSRVERLLDRLQLPHVAQFHYSFCGPRVPLYDSITSLLARSTATLDYLVNIFQQCSSLQELSLTRRTAFAWTNALSRQDIMLSCTKLRSFTVSIERSFNLAHSPQRLSPVGEIMTTIVVQRFIKPL